MFQLVDLYEAPTQDLIRIAHLVAHLLRERAGMQVDEAEMARVRQEAMAQHLASHGLKGTMVRLV